MTITTQTATDIRFIHQHTHLAAFQRVPPLCAGMEPTVSVSTEAARAPIMGALRNGSDLNLAV
jgi:hypothetical protein